MGIYPTPGYQLAYTVQRHQPELAMFNPGTYNDVVVGGVG